MSLQRLYDLFDRACDLDPRAQAAFVARECAGDPALADRLRALLRAEQQVPSSFLDNALDVTVAPAELATDTGPPEHIGPYRVLRGDRSRGAWGSYTKRSRNSPRRRVAVKVLRGVTASDEGLKRFEREARVLGRLFHPGIAHIHDAGSALVGDEVWPYFAMEFIEGRRLDDYLDVSGADRTARLRLFVEICDAVEHAHFHRIFHPACNARPPRSAPSTLPVEHNERTPKSHFEAKTTKLLDKRPQLVEHLGGIVASTRRNCSAANDRWPS